jgi:hypothetical protein
MTDPTPEQVIHQLGQTVEQNTRQLYADGHAIVEDGRTRHGEAIMDAAVQDITAKLGDGGVNAIVDLARNFNQPSDLLVHLSSNPDRLEKLAGMTPAQASVELARIESQMSPHGHGGSTPAWRNPSNRSGRTSDKEWKANHGAHLTDEQWSREFDRRARERRR